MVDKTIFVGKYFKELESVDSTNSFAAELVKKNEAKHGMIVFTTHQTNGKGQREKVWNSEPKKNLTFSLTIMKKELNIYSELELLAEYLEKWIFKLSNREFICILETYKHCLWNAGRAIKFENRDNEIITGIFLDIDESGTPKIIDSNGKTYYFSETKSIIYK